MLPIKFSYTRMRSESQTMSKPCSSYLRTLDEDLKQKRSCQDFPKHVISDRGTEIELDIPFAVNLEPQNNRHQSNSLRSNIITQ